MLAYKRNVKTRRLLLRLAFCVALPFCVLLFKTGYSKPAYVVAVALVLLSPVSFTQLVLTESRITVVKYFLFGFLPVKWMFTNKDLIDARLVEESEAETMPSYGWWEMLSLFFPLSVKWIGVEFKYKRANGSIALLRVGISSEEYQLLASRKAQVLTHYGEAAS